MTWRKINLGMFSLFVAVMLLITSNVLLAHSNENSQRTISSCNSLALIHSVLSPMNLQQEIAYSDTADTSDTSSDTSSDHGYSVLTKFLKSPISLKKAMAYSDTSDTSSDSSSSHGYSLLREKQPVSSYASLMENPKLYLITRPIQNEQSAGGKTVAVLAQDLQSKLGLNQSQTEAVETILKNYQSSLHSSGSALTPGAQGNGMRVADPKATASSRIEALLTKAQKSTWSTIQGDWWKEVDTKLGS